MRRTLAFLISSYALMCVCANGSSPLRPKPQASLLRRLEFTSVLLSVLTPPESTEIDIPAEDSSTLESLSSSSSPSATTTKTIESNTNVYAGVKAWAIKLTSLPRRTLSTITMLVGFMLLVNLFQAKGLGVLLLVLSPGLYHEACSVVVVNPEEPPNRLEVAFQWWWFFAASLATTVPLVLGMYFTNTAQRIADVSHLVSYSMICLGVMMWIFCLSMTPEDSVTIHFQSAWNQISLYITSILLTMLPITFWMKTLIDIENGLVWAMYTVLLIILNESMSYLFGSTIGKSSIMSVVSPHKTWEGWLGATGTTLLMSWPLWRDLRSIPYNIHALTVTLFCCIAAPFGGFLASSVKRAGGKKDFSTLIAGHGGLMDRLDCQVMTAPFLYLYLKATQK